MNVALLVALLLTRAVDGSSPTIPPPTLDEIRSQLAAGDVVGLDGLSRWVDTHGTDRLDRALIVMATNGAIADHRFAWGVQLIESWVGSHPLDGELAHLAATLFSESGRIARWAELLDRALGRAGGGDDAVLRLERARVHFSLKEFEAALAVVAPLSTDADGGVPAVGDDLVVPLSYLRGACLAGLGRPAESIAPLSRVLELEPNHHAARLELGRARLRLGDAEGAVATLRPAVQAVGLRSATLQALGQALVRSGHFDEGRHVLDAFRRANELEEREKDLTAQVGLDPTAAPALVEWVEFLVRHHPEHESTRPALERALRLHPGVARLWIARGRLLQTENVEAAKDAFVHALELDKHAYEARIELAEICLRHGNLSLADRFLARCEGRVDSARWSLARA
ncbi:MAG: tetratricopeptide repeat protein, partial [Planctomycetes bacterium]|nr:tetratricopeptide repeat protein [Planctomycetota bacterium]